MRDRLAVAICGCGTIARLMIQSYLKLDEGDDWNHAYLYGTIDPRKSAAKQLAEEYAREKGCSVNDIKIFTSLKEALRDPQIDVVIINTPHQIHLKQTEMCLEAGKHTSLQKVPVMTLPEMRRIIELSDKAEERGIKFHVFENFRFHPPYAKMKEILDSGECGELKSVYYNMVASLGEGTLYYLRGKGTINPISSWKWKTSEEGTYSAPATFDDGYHKHSIMNLWLGHVRNVRAWYGGYLVDEPAAIQYSSNGGKYGLWSSTIGLTLPVKSNYYTGDEFVRFDCTDGIIISNGCTGTTFEGASECGGVGEPGVYWYDKWGKWHADCSMPTDWKYSFALCGRYFIDETINGSGKASLSAREACDILKTGMAVVTSARNKSQEIDVDSIDKVHGKSKGALAWYLKPVMKLIRAEKNKE